MGYAHHYPTNNSGCSQVQQWQYVLLGGGGQKEEKTALGHLSLFKHQLVDIITNLATNMWKKCFFSIKG